MFFSSNISSKTLKSTKTHYKINRHKNPYKNQTCSLNNCNHHDYFGMEVLFVPARNQQTFAFLCSEI